MRITKSLLILTIAILAAAIIIFLAMQKPPSFCSKVQDRDTMYLCLVQSRMTFRFAKRYKMSLCNMSVMTIWQASRIMAQSAILFRINTVLICATTILLLGEMPRPFAAN